MHVPATLSPKELKNSKARSPQSKQPLFSQNASPSNLTKAQQVQLYQNESQYSQSGSSFIL